MKSSSDLTGIVAMKRMIRHLMEKLALTSKILSLIWQSGNFDRRELIITKLGGISAISNYKHNKTSGEYEVIGVGRLQNSRKVLLLDDALLSIYRNPVNNEFFLREIDEFSDGRFSRIDRNWELK